MPCVAFALACACGGKVGGSGDGGVPDGASSPPTTAVTTFAIRTLHLGEADVNGTPSAAAWKSYGRNVDGERESARWVLDSVAHA